MTTLQKIAKQLQAIQAEEVETIRAAATSADLEEIRLALFGKKGRISTILRAMGSLDADERPQAGKIANEIKDLLQQAFNDRAEQIRTAELDLSVEQERIDISLPGIRPDLGALHPISRVRRELEDIFVSMGFSIRSGPDIEDDYHNFAALNFADDHPARDMHDTLYLNQELLLRTHTSPVQIRTLSTEPLPLAIIAPGKCYRCDPPDATHSPMFHQIEGFMVDTNIRFSDLKGVLLAFIQKLFGPDTPFRLRPSFFPFTEPSAEVDIFFERRHPEGHIIRSWEEVLGAGMIHPNVLSNCGIDPDKYTGFAFGMGIERLTMMKYGINSLYSFYENDLRFLRQFR